MCASLAGPWTEWVQAVAGAISAAAALLALAFAWATVRETRALRREDRLARLPELAAELGDVGLRVAQGAAFEKLTALPVARQRLRAALASSGESLPACEALLTVDWPTGISLEDAETMIAAALDELGAMLAKLRG